MIKTGIVLGIVVFLIVLSIKKNIKDHRRIAKLRKSGHSSCSGCSMGCCSSCHMNHD
ncbi:MAG: hypothetical protein LKF96_03040 [Treponema sp.]|nr:hypothetical protein [Treponema sp.]